MVDLKLSELDYVILEHVYNYSSIDYSEVIDLIGVDGPERINNLLSLGLLEDLRNLTYPDDKSKDLGLFISSYKGIVVVKNYNSYKKQKSQKDKEEFWNKMFFSFVIPIIATIATTIIINNII